MRSQPAHANVLGMENWRAIEDFAGLYEVSDAGSVRRVDTGNLLKPYYRGGYPCVSLKNGKRKRCTAVHLLVLEAFVGPRPAKRQGAHLDGNEANAALSNLAWVTQVENERHKRLHGSAKLGEKSHLAKLTDEQASIIREVAGAGITQAKIARLVGLSETAIGRIVMRKSFA